MLGIPRSAALYYLATPTTNNRGFSGGIRIVAIAEERAGVEDTSPVPLWDEIIILIYNKCHYHNRSD